MFENPNLSSTSGKHQEIPRNEKSNKIWGTKFFFLKKALGIESATV